MSTGTIGLPPISTEIIVKSDKVASGMKKAGMLIDSEAKKLMELFLDLAILELV